jgi:hypothetical protein
MMSENIPEDVVAVATAVAGGGPMFAMAAALVKEALHEAKAASLLS